MNVFELFATLGLDSSGYDEGLANAEQKGSSFGATMGSVLATGAKVAVGALAATTTAAIAGTTAFVNGISATAEYGDRIDKMSQKMNLSAEAFQEWDFIMQHAGTSIESMQAGIKTLSNAAETGNEAFQQLGISQEEIAEMSGEELFESTITALQGVEDETQRTYLAGQLLGRGATELGPLLNMTAEETEAMKDQVHELGGVLSDDAVSASAGFQDSLQNMQTALTGVKNNMLSEFLPSFSTVMDGLAAVFSGDDSGLGMIDEGVDDFIQSLNEVAPRAMEVGSSILTSLISAISSNLPSLIAEGGDVINQLVQGVITALPALLQSAVMIIGQIGSALIKNAPLLISTALDLILTLANGLTQSLPSMIPAITGVITEIVRTLTSPENLEMFIQVALDLILALAEGLVAATPDLVSVIPEIMANIIVTMQDMWPEVLNSILVLLGDLGVMVLEALAALMGTSFADVYGGLQSIGEAITGAFNNIKQWFTDLKTNLSETVSNLWDSITGFFSDGLANAKETVESVLGSIHDKFSEIFENVKSVVSGAIDFIKGLFDFEWSLPDIKLPHFSIEGSLDVLASPPKIPKVSVDWYQRGYTDAYILNGATIFGAQGGSLLGGGEGTGGEVVVGTDKLISMMSEAVKQAIGSGQTTIIPVYIGTEKIDELVVKSKQRTDYISGGR